MITPVPSDNVVELRGLKDDVKPIGSNCTNANIKAPIANGSIYFEIDTSKVYMMSIDESTSVGVWLEI